MHNVSKASVSRCIVRVSQAIMAVADKFIRFPNDGDSLRTASHYFYASAGLPNVIGAVDGNFIRIKKPHMERDVSYVCRKGFHVLNVQIVCDNQLSIVNVVARYPASCHDSHNWRFCALRRLFSTGQIPNYWLLGDQGYPLEPWLLTPIENPQNNEENAY